MKIELPFRTPSINHLHGHNKFGAFYLKPEARKLREEIKELIINQAFPLFAQEEVLLKVTTEIHEDWYTKKGLVKRKDIGNREKFLVDSVFDALGMDDKFIFEHTMKKVQSNKEFAIIIIKEYKKKNEKRETNTESEKISKSV